jgi:hypothetical protein
MRNRTRLVLRKFLASRVLRGAWRRTEEEENKSAFRPSGWSVKIFHRHRQVAPDCSSRFSAIVVCKKKKTRGSKMTDVMSRIDSGTERLRPSFGYDDFERRVLDLQRCAVEIERVIALRADVHAIDPAECIQVRDLVSSCEFPQKASNSAAAAVAVSQPRLFAFLPRCTTSTSTDRRIQVLFLRAFSRVACDGRRRPHCAPSLMCVRARTPSHDQ